MQKRVLVIDAIATHRIRFAALLETARYAVRTVSVSENIGSLRDCDLVVLGLPSHEPGRVISSVLAQLTGTKAPVLCLDAKCTPLRRLLVLRAGARDVLPSKTPDELLLARVRGLIREGEAEREAERRRVTAASFGFSEAAASFGSRARLVCIGELDALPGQLSAVTPHEAVHFPAGRILEEDALSMVPDAFLLHAGHGPDDLSTILPELRDQTHLAPVPIMVVYPEDRPELATHALALGASDIVADTAGLEEIELRIARMLARKASNDAMRRSDEQSYRLAATDPLTGLYNRRYAETYMSGLTERSNGRPIEFSLVLIDLDHFKAVNDVHGHAAGDSVLREVAVRLQDNLRACDLIARYGGEEFMVILPETSPEMAIGLAERLRHAVSNRSVKTSEDAEIVVTASIGVAMGRIDAGMAEQRTGTDDVPCMFDDSPFQSVFEAADAALYLAKTGGRNRVEVSAA
ncbi:MAG: diguanylate cyclase [Pseudomonadota bacterium]